MLSKERTYKKIFHIIAFFLSTQILLAKLEHNYKLYLKIREKF